MERIIIAVAGDHRVAGRDMARDRADLLEVLEHTKECDDHAVLTALMDSQPQKQRSHGC